MPTLPVVTGKKTRAVHWPKCYTGRYRPNAHRSLTKMHRSPSKYTLRTVWCREFECSFPMFPGVGWESPSGESEQEEEKDNSFNKREEETGLEYTEPDDVVIPTIEQETLAEKAAEVIETLSLELKLIANPAPIPDLLTRTSILDTPKPTLPDPLPHQNLTLNLLIQLDQWCRKIWWRSNCLLHLRGNKLNLIRFSQNATSIWNITPPNWIKRRSYS